MDAPIADIRQITRPKAIFAVGRGARGKTVAFRWMVDRALAAGRSVTIADGDRTNQTLAAFFPGLVQSPPSGDDEDMQTWLEELLEQAMDGPGSIVVDLGGGDRLLRRVALDLDLMRFLQTCGIEPVMLHFVGADRDDLAYLREAERDGMLAPERTAVVFNEGVVPAGLSMTAAWAKHKGDELLRGSVGRGARIIVMPRLSCMVRWDDGRVRFSDACHPLHPFTTQNDQIAHRVGRFDAQRTTLWLREMETAFEPIADWLP